MFLSRPQRKRFKDKEIRATQNKTELLAHPKPGSCQLPRLHSAVESICVCSVLFFVWVRPPIPALLLFSCVFSAMSFLLVSWLARPLVFLPASLVFLAGPPANAKRSLNSYARHDLIRGLPLWLPMRQTTMQQPCTLRNEKLNCCNCLRSLRLP